MLQNLLWSLLTRQRTKTIFARQINDKPWQDILKTTTHLFGLFGKALWSIHVFWLCLQFQHFFLTVIINVQTKNLLYGILHLNRLILNMPLGYSNARMDQWRWSKRQLDFSYDYNEKTTFFLRQFLWGFLRFFCEHFHDFCSLTRMEGQKGHV